MSRKKSVSHDQDDLITILDDETYEEIAELGGQEIVHIIIWEDSVADALQDSTVTSDDQELFDIDLYLKDGVYLELFGVLCYKSLDVESLQGAQAVNQYLAALQSSGGFMLTEIAADEEDSPVFVLGKQQTPAVYLVAGACAIAEWTELP